ncbi:UNVERIFIED_CONTAM: hypothetical protein HDU68_012518 [Siphonaria sp. JEL0065]|nr:hypothetical protein HDU68_012518 [Siphonaria sp. JEL0065]
MHLILLAVALVLVQSTLAFTNGTLLPPYLCAPPGDGMPKSLGGVLNFAVFNKDTPLAFNPTTANNLAMTPATMNDSPVNTAFMLASFHNTINSIAPMQNVISVTSTNNAPLTPGTAFALTLSSRGGVPLDGTMIYAQDVASGARLGSFTDTGAIFSAFPGCGQDAQGNNFGMVHNQIVSAGGTYTQLSFNAPATLTAGQQVAIKGLAVDDNGFGFHCQVFTVGSGAAAPCQCAATGAISNIGIDPAATTAGGGGGANNGTTVATGAGGVTTGTAAAGTGTGAGSASSATTKAAKPTTKPTKATKATKATKSTANTKATKAKATKATKAPAKTKPIKKTAAPATTAANTTGGNGNAMNPANPAAGNAATANTGGIAVLDANGNTIIVPLVAIPDQ